MGRNTHDVFVGDLGPEVNDEVLHKAFSAFSSLSVARVMCHAKSSKALGHGLLTFSDRADAEKAIANMNGEYLGSGGITLRWASQNLPEGPQSSVGQWTYESIVRQAPSDQTTLYIGNLVPYCTQGDLIPLFQGFGYIVSMEIQADHGKASVRLDTHENAAMAILNLNGCHVHGHPMKCDVCTQEKNYLILPDRLTFQSGNHAAL